LEEERVEEAARGVAMQTRAGRTNQGAALCCSRPLIGRRFFLIRLFLSFFLSFIIFYFFLFLLFLGIDI